MDCKSTSTKNTDGCGDCGRSHAEHHQPGFDGRGKGYADSCITEGFRVWDSYHPEVRCRVRPEKAVDFEAHIIFDSKHAESAAALAVAVGWKFSKIDADPYLGPGVRCYLTTHGADREKLEQSMRGVAAGAQALGFPALRMKIEQIVLDVRF